MIAHVVIAATPSPVYWLLNLLQLLGALGIIGGLWFLATKADARLDEYRIRRQMKKPVKIDITADITADTTQYIAALKRVRDAARRAGRSDRGAGRLETIFAWAFLIGMCAAAWALVGYGLIRLAVQ